MSIFVYHSNSLGTLAQRLASKIGEETAENADFFSTNKVIVPNYNIANWLKLQIAGINGICINVEFQYLEQGLWAVLEQLAPKFAVKHLTRPVLEILILRFLLDEENRDPDLEMIRKYLGSSNRGNYCAKIWQLAQKFARLFSEYEYHRQEIISKWQDNAFHFDDAIASQVERCQRAIYRQIFRDEILKLGTIGEANLATLPQFFRKIARERKPFSVRNFHLHLFAFSHLSPFHRHLLFELGNWIDLSIYHFNVCAEFWEDVDTEYEEFRDPQRTGQKRKNEDHENDLLKAWSRPGRETVRFLSQLEEQCLNHYSFESEWLVDEIDPSTNVLRFVQHQVLHRYQGELRLPQDQSIQLASCPSRYREVESVYNSILYNLKEDKELQLGDIAIFVGNFEVYYPVIRAIFDRNSQFSYCFVDLNDASESLYAEAAIQLLSLAYGTFTRKELFALFSNPCFRAAAGISEEEMETWLKWVDKLNIIRGVTDINDASLDFSANEPFTWNLGLKRLRLGQLMENPDSDLEHTLRFEYSGLVPYEDFESLDRSLLDRFVLTIELLATEIRSLRSQRSAVQWQDTLTRFFPLFLDVPEYHPEEEITRRTLVEALDEIRYLEGAECTRKLELKLIIEFLKSRLHGYPDSSLNRSSRGVSIASLRPMRPLPFKQIYILGLNENDFPGREISDHQDLRSFGKKSSDFSQAEVNMYLFLETITCAREKLYLSFISRDLQKDHPLHASHIIHTFLRYLNAFVLREDFQIVEIPLNNRSPLYLDSPFAYTDLLHNFNAQDRIMTLYEFTQGRPKSREKFREKLDTLVHTSQREFKVSLEDRKDKEVVPVSIAALSRFLQNPVQIGAQVRLGYSEDDAINILQLEDEPTYSQYGPMHTIAADLVRYFFLKECGEKELADYFDELYEFSNKKSQVPVGSYGEIDRDRVFQMLLQRIYGGENIKGTLSQLAAVVNKNTLHEHVSFGPYPKPCTCVLDALEFKLPIHSADTKTSVEVYGNVPFIWQNEEGAFTDALVITNAKGRDGEFPPSIFSAFIFYLCSLLACRTVHGNFFRIHLSHSAGVQSYSYSKMTARTAQVYLTRLLQSINSEDAFDLLPYSVITKTKKLQAPIRSCSDEPNIDKALYTRDLESAILQEVGNQFSTFHLTDFEKLLNPKVPIDAYDKIRDRFRPLYHSHKIPLSEQEESSSKEKLSFDFT